MKCATSDQDFTLRQKDFICITLSNSCDISEIHLTFSHHCLVYVWPLTYAYCSVQWLPYSRFSPGIFRRHSLLVWFGDSGDRWFSPGSPSEMPIAFFCSMCFPTCSLSFCLSVLILFFCVLSVSFLFSMAVTCSSLGSQPQSNFSFSQFLNFNICTTTQTHAYTYTAKGTVH